MNQEQQHTRREEQEQATRGEEIVLKERQETKPARVLKPVSLVPYKPRRIDSRVVSFDYYDAFNYSTLSGEQKNLHMTLGVTSANPNEGKTHVASNLAVSLALAHEKKTVLVDLNIRRPRLDGIFGVPQGPGLIEAIKGGDIKVWPTQVENLFVFPAGGGNGSGYPPDQRQHDLKRPKGRPSMRLNQLTEFRDVLFSLEQEYDFIVVDVPAINGREFPILYAGQLEGLLVVIDSKRTKKKDLDKMFRVVNEKQVMGFVFNRFRDED